MKKILFILTITGLLSSCVSSYIQICSVTPLPSSESKVSQQNEGLVYEDMNCKLIYSMWAKGGDLSFILQNQTNNDLYLLMDKSFFIKNGVAQDYYIETERTYKYSRSTNSNSSSAASAKVIWLGVASTTPGSIGISSSEGESSSVGYEETVKASKIICIPANSRKVIASFSISTSVIKDCDDGEFNYPKKESRIIHYTPDNSPVLFENRITYSTVEDLSITKNINTSFYLSEVINYIYKEGVAYKNTKYTPCGSVEDKYENRLIVGGAANQYYNRYDYQVGDLTKMRTKKKEDKRNW